MFSSIATKQKPSESSEVSSISELSVPTAPSPSSACFLIMLSVRGSSESSIRIGFHWRPRKQSWETSILLKDILAAAITCRFAVDSRWLPLHGSRGSTDVAPTAHSDVHCHSVAAHLGFSKPEEPSSKIWKSMSIANRFNSPLILSSRKWYRAVTSRAVPPRALTH